MRPLFLSLMAFACLANPTPAQRPRGKAEANEQPKKIPSLKPLTISAKEDELLKLQKEKLNAAIEELNINFSRFASGKTNIAGERDVGFPFSGRLKEAVLDLNNSKMTMDTVNDYYATMQSALEISAKRFTEGVILPEEHHRVRYFYLDAKILQVRMKKQLNPK